MDSSRKMRPAKVLAIQFSILSPTDIKNGSVAEITSHETYNNNKPIINGVFDPRMGVLDGAYVCPTDGLGYMKTPGYFGHLELAQPVFYVQYLTHIKKILKCVCIKCSKLLLNKANHMHVLKMAASDRAEYVYKIASEIKRCGFDTIDGCGCKQPKSISKLKNTELVATWDKHDETLKITPELAIKMLSRISNEDVHFLGYNPVWSRPEWMVCSVLAIPPPAVRPSVKANSQRTEDDLTITVINIIKANNELRRHKNDLRDLEQKTDNEEARKNKQHIIGISVTALQYHIASMVDNNQPSVPQVAQRSGRPFKTIKARLNGKQGRIRQNLMGKRVNFSARSVITPDPNLSITELGIPLQIAQNITKPVRVNKRNLQFLQQLVINGPEPGSRGSEVLPGAKRITKVNGDEKMLNGPEVKRQEQAKDLKYGDIVHRHIMNGDPVIFNRQPTLHRMSMMCHVARIMVKGDTFRMNVADTKPYNADFDGDEMNMHMPQDVESESELLQLAAVPWQLISPANNKSIIGIFQDSLLGAYQLTRNTISAFTRQQAMNLLMAFDRIDVKKLAKNDISNFEILSQILPPLTLHYKLKKYDDESDPEKKKNKMVAILNGKYTSGQLDKQLLGDGSSSMIQRICNDYGNQAAVHFIDNLQNVVTEYMKISGFSVGISDLVTGPATKAAVLASIKLQKDNIRQLEKSVLEGTFKNPTGLTNKDYFEHKVNNLLNEAKEKSEQIVQKSLSTENRFIIMLNAGSKGQATNISQMMACVGPQQVDNQRIPYGFEQRALPHFAKYDDSAEARGFVTNSFISGLTPEELFFHAMAGRIGIIDTAVKTATTGYVQRRLIKGMEDLKVEYDMTVRNNKFKIVQFCYGDDAFDPVRVENQMLPLAKQSLEDLYLHFYLADYQKDELELIFTETEHINVSKFNAELKPIVDFILNLREELVSAVFMQKSNETVYLPVAFAHIINNIQGQCQINKYSKTNLTPSEAWKRIQATYEQIQDLFRIPNDLFKAMYYYYLNPNYLLIHKRIDSIALNLILHQVLTVYKKSIIAPGEMVGIIAAQSIGEPTTQMTLNTFHYAGVASKSNVTRGLPRLEEIINFSPNPKKQSCTVFLPSSDQLEEANAVNLKYALVFTSLHDVVDNIQIIFNPANQPTVPSKDQSWVSMYEEFCKNLNIEDNTESPLSPWIIRIELNADKMVDRNITMADIHWALEHLYHGVIQQCVFSDYNNDQLVFRIRFALKTTKKQRAKGADAPYEQFPLDQSDEIYKLTMLQQEMMHKLVLRGVKNISNATIRKLSDVMVLTDTGSYQPKDIWVIDTVGSNLLELLAWPGVNAQRTSSNNITEVLNVLGVEAARLCVMNEMMDVITFDGSYINYHHINLMCDRMAVKYGLVAFQRHDINRDDIGPLAKASFEKTTDEFLKAAAHAEVDNMRGISANIMCGQEGYYGTNSFQVHYDLKENTRQILNPTCKNITSIENVAQSLLAQSALPKGATAEQEYNMFDD